jgi:hypothetical protein
MAETRRIELPRCEVSLFSNQAKLNLTSGSFSKTQSGGGVKVEKAVLDCAVGRAYS